MADIELVIRIPEEIYKSSKKECDENDSLIIDTFTYAIGNGTPLPKGHGRLIDEKEIDTVVNGIFSVFDTYSSETFLCVIHNQCIETVGADGGRK